MLRIYDTYLETLDKNGMPVYHNMIIHSEDIAAYRSDNGEYIGTGVYFGPNDIALFNINDGTFVGRDERDSVFYDSTISYSGVITGPTFTMQGSQCTSVDENGCGYSPFTVTATSVSALKPVPVPAALPMLLSGILGLAAFIRRSRKLEMV